MDEPYNNIHWTRVLILRPTVDSTRSDTDEDMQPSPTDINETEENEISIVRLMRLVPPA